MKSLLVLGLCGVHFITASDMLVSMNANTEVEMAVDNVNIATEERVFDFPTIDKCTAIAVGRLATADGGTMTTHTADCAECDWRINKVPGKIWPAGSQRPIYLISSAYPRQVREDRGFTWSPSNLEDIPSLRPQWEAMKGEIIGYIPQAERTFDVIEGMYGIMNEHQVAMGESTCAAKLWASPRGSAGGKALFEIGELSQVALERSTTARQAVQMMGDLATTYGYYSAEWKWGPFGESIFLFFFYHFVSFSISLFFSFTRLALFFAPIYYIHLLAFIEKSRV